MNGLKKLRQHLKRQKSIHSSERYIYTPLPINKNGYIIEFRHSHFSEIYYYKYKENVDGTLTKYGYLICDNYKRNSKFRKNDDDDDEINYKKLFHNNDKECIFYQTVADKVQIALEKRWMNELRQKGKLEVSTINENDDDLFNSEWSELMQHNNDWFISDNIQRRRLAEILGESNLSNLYNDDKLIQNTCQTLSSIAHQLSNESSNNYNYYFTPPLSPKTPPSSPTENYKHISPKSLLNMNIRQRVRNRDKQKINQNEGKSQDEERKEKVRKLVHLTNPKFSREAPSVHLYDPEDTLIYKDCRCEYCMIGEYNE